MHRIRTFRAGLARGPFRQRWLSPARGAPRLRPLCAAAAAGPGRSAGSRPPPPAAPHAGSSEAAALLPFLLAAAAASAASAEGARSESAPVSADVLSRLASIVGEDNVSVDEEERALRGEPQNSYHRCGRIPDVIVAPCSTEEVSRVMKLCWELGLAVTPYGGATSIEGQLLTPMGGVSLDMRRMKGLLRVREDDMDVTVQPGLGYLELNEMLRPRGLWFPLDPGPGASIGGMASCRCSGSTAVRYGTMRENVISLTVVLADGSVVKTAPRARKSAAGYDLTRLFVGAEGTLGVITEATLKVYRVPTKRAALRYSFRDASDAAGAVRSVIQRGIVVGRAELMDAAMIRTLNRANGTAYNEEPTVLFELTGETQQEMEAALARVRTVVDAHAPTTAAFTADERECEDMWRERKEALWTCFAAYPDRTAFITDVCVPVSGLPELLRFSQRAIDASGLPGPIVAHAGDGNLHALLMVRPGNAEDMREAERLSGLMVEKAHALDGTCTGEHGVGVGKRKYLEAEVGESGIRLMSSIKGALDPKGMLNPGKILRPGAPKLYTSKDDAPASGCP